MMAALLDVASWLLLTVGGIFYVIGAIGLLRMPDVFTRMHAASVSDTLGVGLLLAGMMLQSGWSLVTLKLIIIMIVLFHTGPVASHALARAARYAGFEPKLHKRKR